jgi:hypothetical protein
VAQKPYCISNSPLNKILAKYSIEGVRTSSRVVDFARSMKNYERRLNESLKFFFALYTIVHCASSSTAAFHIIELNVKPRLQCSHSR